MQASHNLSGSFFSGENLLLGVAVVVAVSFVVLLAVDVIRRRRRDRRRRGGKREGLRDKLLQPVHRAQGFRTGLRQMLHERARRERGNSPKPPETRP